MSAPGSLNLSGPGGCQRKERPMRYRVEVAVGDYMTGSVTVDADSPEDAKAEAEEAVKASSVEAVRVWEDQEV